MTKRFKRERLSTKWLWLVLVVIGCVLVIPAVALKGSGAGAQSSATGINAAALHPALTAKQRKARSDYWIAKQGFQFGVPSGAFNSAIASVKEEATGSVRKLSERDLATPSFTWNFLGPEPIQLLTYFTTGVAFGPVHSGAGRFTSVAVDPNTNDNGGGDIVAGSANGGVYLSTDGGTAFSQIFANEPTQAVGAVAIDPTTTPSTIYVGTGDGNGSLDSYYGAGVFKSADLGATWTQIMPASFADGYVSVTKIAIDPSSNQIFVGATEGVSASRADASVFETDATQAGLWVSPDKGTTWNQYPISAFNNCIVANIPTDPCPADDIAIDPNPNSSGSHNIYVAIDQQGLYISTNDGSTFSYKQLEGATPAGRDSIAVGPTTTAGGVGIVYVMAGALDGVEYQAFFRSTDANTFTAVAVPTFASGGVAFDGVVSSNQSQSFYSQSFYDQAMAVLPSSNTTVFFGGVGLYESTSGGSSWTPLINNAKSNTSVGGYSEQHALAYDSFTSPPQMLVANDGGLYSFDPSQTANVTFTSLNTNIDTTLVQGIGPHPTNDGLLVAGFQDGGTQIYQGSVSNWLFNPTETGDGGFALYDPTDPNYVYHTFSNDNEDTNVSFSFSNNGGSSWTSAKPSTNLAAALVASGDPGAAFYPPIAVDPTVSHRVLFGAHSIYASNNGGATWVAQNTFDLTGLCADGSCALEDLEFASHTNLWALAMGTIDLSYPFVLSNSTAAEDDTSNTLDGDPTWTDAHTTALAGAGVGNFSTQATGITVDPNNPNNAFVSLSGFFGGAGGTGVGHIYKTTNFGSTWAEADGGVTSGTASPPALPDVPVLRVLVDRADTTGNTIYAATDIGVFKSSDGGNTWGSFNLGTIPAVPVFDIEQNQNNTIFIGTHGHGVFQLAAATPSPSPTSSATPSPSPSPTPESSPTPTPSPTPVPGTLTISPASVSFPSQVFGGSAGVQSGSKTITVSNPKKGKTPPTITIESLTPTGDANGTYTTNLTAGNACFVGDQLAPGQKCTIAVTYTPLQSGKSTGSLAVTNNGTKQLTATLKGTGALGAITAAPKSLAFGKVTDGTTSTKPPVTITNKNAVPIAISTITFVGKDPQYYSEVDTCNGSVPASGNCTVTVTFAPTASGSLPGTLEIIGTLKGTPLKVNLTGTGQ